MPAPSRAELIKECIRAVACPVCGVAAGALCFWRYSRGIEQHHHWKRDMEGMKLFHEKYGVKV